MMPRGFGKTAESAAAAFLSNVFFCQTTDYFDADVLAQPLLHTWSLAVEEQFDILFPPLLALVWRRLREGWIILGLVAVTLASLALAQWGAGTLPKVNSFFTLSRMWEVLLGSLGAFAFANRALRPNAWAAGLGLLAILVSLALFRAEPPQPSVLTLTPVLGALMVLLWTGPETAGGRVLSLKPVMGVSRISYSLYLWHFPVFAFAVAQGAVGEDASNIAAQVGLVVALALASWRYVETPFRHRIAGQGPGRVLWRSAAALVLVILVGQVLGHSPSVTWRYLAASPDERAMLMFPETYQQDHDRLKSPTLCFFQTPSSLKRAAVCIPSRHPNLVLLGDSHAAALARGFAAQGFATGVMAGPGCGPFMDDGWSLSADCARENAEVVRVLRANSPDVLVLHAYWRSKRDLKRLLPDTVLALRRDLPMTRIIVVGGAPYWIASLPERIVVAGVLGQFDAMVTAQLAGVTHADDRLAQVLSDQIAARDVSFVRLTDLPCQGDAAAPMSGRLPLCGIMAISPKRVLLRWSRP